MKLAILLSAFLLAAGAAAAQAQAQSETPAPTVKTFPPKSDCDFLDGSARQRCLERRGAASRENQQPMSSSSSANVITPTLPSSGGSNSDFQNRGMIGGLGSLSTLPDSEPMPVPRGNTYSPNSIGNPWAGTSNSSGTGLMPR